MTDAVLVTGAFGLMGPAAVERLAADPWGAVTATWGDPRPDRSQA